MSGDKRLSVQLSLLAPEWQAGTYEWWPAADRVIWSPDLVRIYGLENAPEAEPQFTECVHPDDRVRVEGETSTFLGSDAESYSHTFRIVRPDGDVRVILDRGAIERDASGNVRVIRGINIDVTEDAGLCLTPSHRTVTSTTPNPGPNPGLNASRTQLHDAMQDGSTIAFDWDIRADRVHRIVNDDSILPPTTDQPETFQQVVEAIHPDDRAAFRAAVEAAIEPGDGIYRSEHRIVGANGAVRCIASRGRVEFEHDGTPVRLLGTSHDITDRKRIEEELAEAKAVLDSLFDSAPVGLALWDSSFRFLRINRKLADINGIPPEAHIGQRPDKILPRLADFDEIYGQWRQVLESGVPLREVEISGETPAEPGRIRHWVVDFFPVSIRDRNLGIAAIVQETTQRKAAEEALRASESRYRTIFEAMDEGFCVAEVRLDAPDGRIDYRVVEANRAFYARTGFPEAIFGRWLREAAPDLEEHWYEVYGRVARTGEPIRFEQHSEMLGRWFDAFAFRLDAAGGCDVAILFSDITERKQHEHRQRMFMREVNHRSMNMLSLVNAIARQTASSDNDFIDRFGERIQALAAAQDLLFQHDWTTVPVADLVRSQLAHFEDLVGDRVAMAGPALSLTPDAAQAVGMALHELATNAAKYGALSNETGRIMIDWSTALEASQDRRFKMSWREQGGPPVSHPEGRGFGSRVTQDMVEAGTGGEVSIEYEAAGLEWRLSCAAVDVLVGAL